MAAALSGPWQQQQVDEFFKESVLPIRLSCIGPDGFPRVISLWYQYREKTLYCVTHQSSKLIKLLEKNNRVAFEVSPDSPPYRGIRGQGIAQMQALGESPLLEELLERYVGDTDSSFSRWLLSRKPEEIIISIAPHRLYSWDYKKRMSGIKG